jgi:hypothetical protein
MLHYSHRAAAASSLLFLWGPVFLPLIFVTPASITAAILPDNLILKACPPLLYV